MPQVPLSPETQRRVDVLFAGAAREQASHLLVTQCGSNLPFHEAADPGGLERIRFAALKLGNGDLAALERAVAIAQVDWRDVLVAADFANDVRAHVTWWPGARRQMPDG